MMFPLKRIVDAIIDDAWSCWVETALENVAVFAVTLEIAKDPAGFVMAAEPRVKSVTCLALIVL